MASEQPDRQLILIAERDPNVRELQRHFLKSAGFDVEFVDDGQAALERARERVPAVVVTEIMLPKLDGLTLCRRLHDDAITQDVPVLVFSILAAEARARDAGAQAFLRKPLVAAVFLATVHGVIAAQSSGITEQQWAAR